MKNRVVPKHPTHQQHAGALLPIRTSVLAVNRQTRTAWHAFLVVRKWKFFWDGGAERPYYVKGDAFTPGDFEKFFFCLHGLTSSIAHGGIKRKDVFHYQCKGRKVTKGYTKERVPLGVGCQYCKMCYRNGDQSLFFKEKRSYCNTSRMGCNQCRETICMECWKLGYDKHKKYKK